MVSIFSFLPEFQADKVEPDTAPRIAVGAASPLWLMFGGAAVAGASYWWWANRWREAVNLEAVMALAPEPVAPPAESLAVLESEPEPIVEAVSLAAEATETALDAAQEIAETVAAPLVDAVVAANADLAEQVVDSEPVVEAAAEVAETVPSEAAAPELSAQVEDAVDDLTRLVGVGPKLAASLAELGVTRFSQIAAWTPDELASFDQLLNLKGRAERDAWIAQAQRLAEPAGS